TSADSIRDGFLGVPRASDVQLCSPRLERRIRGDLMGLHAERSVRDIIAERLFHRLQALAQAARSDDGERRSACREHPVLQCEEQHRYVTDVIRMKVRKCDVRDALPWQIVTCHAVHDARAAVEEDARVFRFEQVAGTDALAVGCRSTAADDGEVSAQPVRISRAHSRFSLYQSTRLRTPCAKLVCGRHSSKRSALPMLAQVASTSAGWRGSLTMFAVLPVYSSTRRTASARTTGSSEPRFMIS